MNLYQAIKDYAGVLKQGENAGGTLLIGQGCSVRSGIPSGDALVALIRELFPEVSAKVSVGHPEDFLAQLNPSQKFHLQNVMLDRARLGWAHICIALMMKEGYIRRVLTTATDPLLERACALMGVHPAVYDCAAANAFDPEKIAGTAIFHLHGQIPGGRSAHLEPVFTMANRFGPWFVVGYKDNADDPVFQALAGLPKFTNGLLWVLPKSIAPSRSVHERILTKGKEVEYTNAKDADAFLILMMQELKVTVPDVLAFPFSFLGRVLRSIANFPAPGMLEELHVMDIALQQLKLAIKDYEGGDWGDLVEGELDMDVLNEPALLKALQTAQTALINGDTRTIIGQREQYERTPNPQLGDLLVWAYLREGDDAYYKAQSDPAQSAELFARARERYEAALNLQPDGSEIVFKLGKLIAQQGSHASGDESKQLLLQAAEKFRQTLALNPDLSPARLQLGHVLVGLAAQSADSEADALFAEATESYQAILDADPENVEAAFGCGLVLYAQARKKKGAEAMRLYGQAAEKLQIGLRFQPQRLDALLPMGHSLLVFSRSKKGEEADRMLALACEKFQYACQLKPDLAEAHFGWADALLERAMGRDDAKAEDYFELALDQYKATVRLKPDLPRAYFRWGLALFHLAQRKEEPEAAAQLYQQAADKFQNAVKLNPNNVDAYLRLARIHLELAKTKKGAEADKLFDRSIQNFESALKLQPGNADALAQLGMVYVAKAKGKDPEQAGELFMQAIAKAQAALEHKSSHVLAHLVWGEALLQIGLQKVDPDIKLFEEAAAQFEEVLKVQPNHNDALVGQAHCMLYMARNMEGEEAEAILENGLNHVQTVLDDRENSAPARNVMAAILMEQARNKRGINAHHLLAEAKGHLQQAEDLDPGSATFNLARLMAQLNNESGCREWLEKCKANGVLPPVSALLKDPLLDTFRESKWFKKLTGNSADSKPESKNHSETDTASPEESKPDSKGPGTRASG